MFVLDPRPGLLQQPESLGMPDFDTRAFQDSQCRSMDHFDLKI
jgi:hypothetical protein